MLYIILAILMFGLLIAVHEFGHFASAKLFGIQVNEFSIGMGPALLKKRKGETLYSVRALPIGGYCAMEGEDEQSSNPRAFGNVAAWKQLVVLAGGAAMNFLTGLLVILILYAPVQGFRIPVYSGAEPGYGAEDCGLQPGDRFLSVDGHRVLVYGNVPLYLSRAGDRVDLVVERNGERLRLDGVYLPYQTRVDENGTETQRRGINIGWEVDPPTVGNKLHYAWNTAVDYVRMVWLSLGELIRGAVGLRDLSGPVGIVDTMSQVGSQSPTAADAARSLLDLAALIAVNLAVMNLLPLPGLDGGRIFFLLLNGVLFALFRKRISAKYEGYVHMVGMAGLLTLSLLVTFSDIGKIFGI